VTIDVFLLRLGSMPVPMKLMEMVEGRTGTIELASYVFLIEHTRDGVKKRILFDLGMRRLDAEMAPHAKHAMALFNCVCPLGAARTLAMNGVDPSSIDAIIISHTHWFEFGWRCEPGLTIFRDHRGDVQDFPKSTE
jgi:glyoxylase-like metal-dependent hydrolase (beta-lactamase superfamily II)